MEKSNRLTNMVVVDGEIVDVFPPKSEKAPTEFRIKWTDTFNEKTRTEYVPGKTFLKDAVRKGAIVHAIGSVHVDRWEDKEGKQRRTTELIFNKIEETGFNGQAVAGEENQEPTVNAPEDEPINLDEIPF